VSLAGTTLGRYRLVEKLGHGGMATVYRAEDTVLGRQVAVKVMHPFIAERSEAGSRFEREAKAVAGLRHPNVMALHDYAPASAEHPAYLVMELLTGPSLQRFLVEHGAPLAEVAAMLALRVAQALAAAHARGIVHRDVKPENVMFDRSDAADAADAADSGLPRGTGERDAPRLASPVDPGLPRGTATAPARVVLCDFGIARVATGEGVTATGALLGSPAYMSPEQASGGQVDARSDQFSLGTLLYQLATGGLPFSASSPLATMAKIVKGEHAPPSAKNGRVPQYLERVIERLLQPQPSARFPSVDACAEALREGLAADGFVDVDGELAAYLRDPAAYNGAAEARIVEAALAQAEQARRYGETAKALAAAARVLAWQSQNRRALEMVEAAAARPRRIAGVIVGAMAIVAVGALAAIRLEVREVEPRPRAAEAARPVPQAVKSVVPVAVATKRAAERRRPPTSPARASADPAPVPSPSPSPPPSPPPSSSPSSVTPASTRATLVVAIAPWCDLSVDGVAQGRTPQTLTLAPGGHKISCVNPASGHRLTRELELAPGERRELRERLYPMVRLQPRLARGDHFSVDGGAATATAIEVEPGRRRVTLYKAGTEVDTRYVDVPPLGCLLTDVPRLACEEP
jgi:serine/threonine-protein kinase